MDRVLSKETAAYEQMREELERNFLGKWVVFHDEEFVGCYDDFQVAAEEAVIKFGRGPYLIREVGERPMALPASLRYQAPYANG